MSLHCPAAGAWQVDYAAALPPIAHNGQQMIDARSLHSWLGVGRITPASFGGKGSPKAPMAPPRACPCADMTTNVIPMFSFNGHQLRGIKIDGEPWFIAPDACRCVGLAPHKNKGTFGHHLSKLDEDERRLVSTSIAPIRNMGVRGALVTLISRPGLLKLAERGTKQVAKDFNRWVRHEVLPQIMDTGAYIAKDADVGGNPCGRKSQASRGKSLPTGSLN